MPPSAFTPTGIPSSFTRTETRKTLSRAMRFRSMWIRLILDRLALPVDNHCLGSGLALNFDIENRIVPGL